MRRLATSLFATATFLLLVPGSAQAESVTRTSSFAYDATTGLLTKEVIEPDDSNLCVVTVYSYDSYGNKTGATTRNCNGSSGEAAAPATGSEALFSSRTSSTGYDTASASVCTTPAGYVAGRFPIKRVNALGHTECLEAEALFGQLTKLTGPNGLATSWTYDVFGRKAVETRADGTTTTWAYSFCAGSYCSFTGLTAVLNHTVSETSTGAPVKIAAIDILGRKVGQKVQSFGSGSDYVSSNVVQMDSNGRAVKTWLPYKDSAGPLTNAYSTVNSYDIAGRQTSVTVPSGVVTTTAYAGLTTTVTVTNGGGSVTTQTRKTVKNSQGQVVSIQTNAGVSSGNVDTTLTYAYDALGNLATTTDPAGNVTKLRYDLRGRKTLMQDADMGVWTYRYNALGELIWQCDAVSRAAGNTATTLSAATSSSAPGLPGTVDCSGTISNGTFGSGGTAARMAYDLLGRLTRKLERDFDSSFAYDTGAKGVGKLATATSTNGYSRSHSYDSVGRASSTAVTINSETFITSVSYDTSGRLGQTQYPAHGVSGIATFAVNHVYNAQGYLAQMVRNSDSVVLWQGNTQYASGLFLTETLGNGLSTTRTEDAAQRLITTYVPGIQNDTWTYDALGNLTSKVDAVNSVTDNYAFDALNRLTQISGTKSGGSLVTREIQYNAIGNVTYKTDAGTYTYPAGGSSSVRPHAVSSVAATLNNGSGGIGGVNTSYGYDANGNLTSASGTIQNLGNSTAVSFSRSLTYLSFNLPAQISQTQNGSAYTYNYTYGPDHERVKLITARPDANITTLHLHPDNTGGLRYERDSKVPAANTLDITVEHKYYVNSPAGLLGVYVVTAVSSGASVEMRYYHRDHLGSITAITNEAGSKIESLAYEAFGERRNANGDMEDKTSPIIGITTDRGYTGHEHLDELNLIHMNGRIYDPVIGRFMTPDPHIQSPDNLQSYNRYTYVLNNPLMYTDPSGHFWQIIAAVVIGAEIAKQTGIIDSGLARTIQGIALASGFIPGGPWAIGGLGAAGSGAIGGFVGGLVSGGSIESGIQGAFSGAAFGAVGQTFPGGPSAVAAHAVVGCISASAGGGSCAQGAVSAAAGKLITIGLGEAGITDKFARGAITAVGGGLTAQAMGGKFANGALTAGFGYLFNCLQSGAGCGSSPEETQGSTGRGLDGKFTTAKEYGEFATGAALTVSIAVVGPEMLVAAGLPRAYWLMTDAEIRGLYSVPVLREFFGSNLAGVADRAADFRIPAGLTRDAALAYREVASRAIQHYEKIGSQAGLALQRGRTELIDRALSALK